jgi:hypothetical protein
VKIEQVASLLELLPAAGAEEAVGADLGEAAREDMLEKPCDEDIHGECQALALVSAGVSVAKGDLTLLESLEGVIGERHAIHIT